MDGTGNVFIVDLGKGYSGRLLKVPAGGGVPIVLVTGTLAYDIAVDPAGDILLPDYYGGKVLKVPSGGGPR